MRGRGIAGFFLLVLYVRNHGCVSPCNQIAGVLSMFLPVGTRLRANITFCQHVSGCYKGDNDELFS